MIRVPFESSTKFWHPYIEAKECRLYPGVMAYPPFIEATKRIGALVRYVLENHEDGEYVFDFENDADGIQFRLTYGHWNE